jgi:type IV secretory pathway VirB2 component (pilin)
VYTDPSSGAPIVAALGWLQDILLGSVATTAAVIAVASIGFLMLTGRIDIRRAAQVVIGCFILFGASSIAQGIVGGVNSLGGQQASAAQATPPLVSPPPPAPTSLPPKAYDPYAGAAVPPQ